jgi:ATP-dependent RNA helicase RhlE
MMQRIRENKEKSGQPARRAGGGNGEGRKAGGNGNAQPARNGGGQQQARNGNGNGNGQAGRGNRPPQPQRPPQGARPPQQPREPRVERDDDGEDRMPRNVDPLRTNLPGRRDMTGVKRVATNGQPDPTRTSIDSMGATGRRNNGGGGGNRGRGGNPARNYGR